MRSIRTSTKAATVTGATVLVLVGLVLAPATALGASPQMPASYYGQVLIDGEPAPAGIEVTAHVDGTVRGRIITGANGSIGGPNMMDEKLDVNGSAEEEGKLVTFEVGNDTASTTVEWSAGDHRRIVLSVPNDTCVRKAVSGDDGRISLREIQEAINWWAEDAPVPDTGGKKINLREIQTLIDVWADGRTVAC